MYICRKVTLPSSSSWMYIAHTIYWLFYVHFQLISRCYFDIFFFNWYPSIYVFFSIGIKTCMLICVICFMHTLNIFIVYCYVWVKGELLWSLTLIHVYITPWVLSSPKRGRLLAQRPITLVLMMINSCSYSLKSQIIYGEGVSSRV